MDGRKTYQIGREHNYLDGDANLEKHLSKLRQLQLCEIEILNEFMRLCEKYELRYYLVGGTLLGAVRHQGFIPWDDDIDVAMPREDYNRFSKICMKELSADYFYQCSETDPYYFLTYAKLRRNGIEIYEERFRYAKFHKGAFIDIFPLDFCPNPGLICHFLFNMLAVMNYRGQMDSGEECKPYKEFSGKIGYTILKIFSSNQLVKIRKNLLKLSERISSKRYFASYSGAYGYCREVYPIEWFNLKEIVFEISTYMCPQDTEAILSQVYGSNYMEPRKTEIYVSND